MFPVALRPTGDTKFVVCPAAFDESLWHLVQQQGEHLGVCMHALSIVNALIAHSVRSMMSTLLLRRCKQADDSIYTRIALLQLRCH